MTAPQESRPRRSDIDGLRGLAVLLVVGFHAGVAWLRGAYLAVDVFFVLSGFFLGATLARRLVMDDDLDLGDLIARRIWRLLPTFIVVALFTLLSAMLLYAPIDRPAVAENLIPVSFFVGNIAFAVRGVNYFHATENPFLHTWTLGVEWQLVIIIPLLVAWFARIGERRAESEQSPHERNVKVLDTVLTGLSIVALLSFVASLIIGARAPMWAYFSPVTRLWPFAIGAVAGILIGGGQSAVSARRIGVMQLVGLIAILAPALLASGLNSYSAWVALPAVIGTLLLLSTGAAATESIAGRALSAKPLVAMGRVSFAWYLWHLPLMVLGGALISQADIGPVYRLCWGAVGLALAFATERWIEEPARTSFVPRLLEERPLVTAALAFAAMAWVAGSILFVTRKQVATTEHRIYAAAREDRVGSGCWDTIEMTPGDCSFGAAGSTTTIALLGDSHANHWLAGLDRAGKENGWKIEPYVKGGCPVSDFEGLPGAPKSDRYDECHRFREEAIRKIIASRPRAALLSSYDSYFETAGSAMSEYRVHESAWTTGLRRTYARLSSAGIPVIVLRGTPRVPFDVPSCLSRRAAELWFATDCSYVMDATHIARARAAQNQAAAGLDVRFVDMQDQVCATSPCATMRNGMVLFTDDNHLTATFTRSLGSELGVRISGALGGSARRAVAVEFKASSSVTVPLIRR